MELEGIPDYLDDEIDILSDSTLQICEKLAYRAHGGTYVAGLFEGGQSTTLEKVPVSAYDIDDFNYFNIGIDLPKDIKGMDSEVTEIPYAAMRCARSDFIGYKSDPPAAPAFQDVRPVGLGSTQLESYGKLRALMKKRNQESEIPALDNIMNDLWGLTKDDLEEIPSLEPDLTLRSDEDIMKYDRSTSHMVYGYDNIQNAMRISTGMYQKERILDNRLIDWNRVHLMARYIGLAAMKPDVYVADLLRTVPFDMKFQLRMSEFPLAIKAPVTPNLSDLPTVTSKPMSISYMKSAVDLYKKDIVKIGAGIRDRLVADLVVKSESLVIDEFLVYKLKKELDKKRTMFTISLIDEEPVPYDLAAPAKKRDTLVKKISKYKGPGVPSLYRAFELVICARMAPAWKTKAVTDAITLCQNADDIRDLRDQKQLIKTCTDAFGISLAHDAFLILRQLLPNDDMIKDRTLDFLTRYDITWADETSVGVGNSLADALDQVMKHPKSAKIYRDLVKSSYGKTVTYFNQSAIRDFPKITYRDPKTDIAALVANLMSRKVKYWHGHYIRRCREYKLSNVPPISELTDDVRTAKMVRYQWLVKMVPLFKVLITETLEIFPQYDLPAVFEALRETGVNFARKQLRLAGLYVEDFDKVIEDDITESIASVADMSTVRSSTWYAKQLDRALTPPIRFVDSFQGVLTMYRLMCRDITKNLRRALFDLSNEYLVDDEDPPDVPIISSTLTEHIVPETLRALERKIASRANASTTVVGKVKYIEDLGFALPTNFDELPTLDFAKDVMEMTDLDVAVNSTVATTDDVTTTVTADAHVELTMPAIPDDMLTMPSVPTIDTESTTNLNLDLDLGLNITEPSIPDLESAHVLGSTVDLSATTTLGQEMMGGMTIETLGDNVEMGTMDVEFGLTAATKSNVQLLDMIVEAEMDGIKDIDYDAWARAVGTTVEGLRSIKVEDEMSVRAKMVFKPEVKKTSKPTPDII